MFEGCDQLVDLTDDVKLDLMKAKLCLFSR